MQQSEIIAFIKLGVYQSGFSRRTEPTIYIIINDLTNCFTQSETGQSNNGWLHAGESENLVAAQSEKLEASQQGEPFVRFQSEAEGLESHCCESILKNWKSGSWKSISNGENRLTHSERMEFAHSGWLPLFSTFVHTTLPVCQMVLLTLRVTLSSSVAISHVNHLWNCLHKHTQNCALLISQTFLNQIKLTIRINYHKEVKRRGTQHLPTGASVIFTGMVR